LPAEDREYIAGGGVIPDVPPKRAAVGLNLRRVSVLKIDKSLAVLLAVMCSAGTAAAEEHVVAQKNKAFSMKKLTVKVGDSVKFVNEDSFAHNVFSLSAIKSFDLGSFGTGGTKSVTFDKPGKVEVECAVHPDMRLDIEVKP
jgi:plastocyanin